METAGVEATARGTPVEEDGGAGVAPPAVRRAVTPESACCRTSLLTSKCSRGRARAEQFHAQRHSLAWGQRELSLGHSFARIQAGREHHLPHRSFTRRHIRPHQPWRRHREVGVRLRLSQPPQRNCRGEPPSGASCWNLWCCRDRVPCRARRRRPGMGRRSPRTCTLYPQLPRGGPHCPAQRVPTLGALASLVGPGEEEMWAAARNAIQPRRRKGGGRGGAVRVRPV